MVGDIVPDAPWVVVVVCVLLAFVLEDELPPPISAFPFEQKPRDSSRPKKKQPN
jgi:hypothetical protein